jgi:hypothetical protein
MGVTKDASSWVSGARSYPEKCDRRHDSDAQRIRSRRDGIPRPRFPGFHPLIWVIDPERRTVMIIAGDAPVRWVRADDTLDGGEVVPGFRCRVAELFDGLAPASRGEEA